MEKETFLDSVGNRTSIPRSQTLWSSLYTDGVLPPSDIHATRVFCYLVERGINKIVFLGRENMYCGRMLPTFRRHLSVYGSTVLLLDLGRFLKFLILYIVDSTAWTGDQPVARPLPTHRTTETQNKCTQTCVPRVGLEITIPAFERAKTVYALDRTAIGIGLGGIYFL
jgi:hypothetical protein